MTLKMAINDLLLHCRFEKNLSPKTIKAYQTDLLQLENFLVGNNYQPEIEKISRNELREYLVSIANLKGKSIKRKVASVKILFNYLEYEDKLLINPLRKMRINIKDTKKLPVVMDIREILKIFKVAYKKRAQFKDPGSYSYFESLRNIAIVELLFSTGARVSEIADLKEDAINLNTGSITIKGKGSKERIIQICNSEAILILKDYYNGFKHKIRNAGNNFLVNRFNKKLSDQSIRNVVKKLAVEAGISKRVTPHLFRHSFATLLLEKDVDIKYIQTLLGHSSIMTTQIYTHVNRVKQRQILKAKHPRKDFTMVVG
jgi:integrase/recombinase XerD